MSDQPFYAPNRATASRRHTRPGEHLWEFGNDHSTWSCERRDDGEAGVEAQILCEGELVSSRRFETLALAVQKASSRRALGSRGKPAGPMVDVGAHEEHLVPEAVYLNALRAELQQLLQPH